MRRFFTQQFKRSCLPDGPKVGTVTLSPRGDWRMPVSYTHLVFAILLGVAAKVFAVEVDERVPLVRECLPGANCGGCGFPGCDGLAAAIVEGRAPVNGCPVGGRCV